MKSTTVLICLLLVTVNAYWSPSAISPCSNNVQRAAFDAFHSCYGFGLKYGNYGSTIQQVVSYANGPADNVCRCRRAVYWQHRLMKCEKNKKYRRFAERRMEYACGQVLWILSWKLAGRCGSFRAPSWSCIKAYLDVSRNDKAGFVKVGSKDLYGSCKHVLDPGCVQKWRVGLYGSCTCTAAKLPCFKKALPEFKGSDLCKAYGLNVPANIEVPNFGKIYRNLP